MDDRIHRYLDGELPWAELSADERLEARGFEEALEGLREDARASSDQDVSEIVMERVLALEAERATVDGADRAAPAWDDSALSRLARWLFDQREFSVRLRPAWGLTAVALLLAAGAWWNGQARRPVDATVTTAEASAPPRVYVRFELTAPDARSVELAGSFSEWSPDIDLRRLSDGRWAALVPLSPGVHDYVFRIDGERWMPDPSAPMVADGFGGYNSRLSLVLADS